MERTRTYECMCLLDNREVRKGWQPLKDAVTGLFSKHGAKVLSARRWDERRLAYPIKGQPRATYMLSYLEASTQQLAGIRRDLQFSDSVLRSMVLACSEVPASAYEPEAEFDVNAIPVEDVESAPDSAMEAAAEEAAAEEAAAEEKAKAAAAEGEGDGEGETSGTDGDDEGSKQ